MTSPLPDLGDDSAYLATKLGEMRTALRRRDGASVLDTLRHLAAEHSQTLANALLANMLEVAMTEIAAGVRAGDPESIAHAQAMLLS